MRKNSRRLPQSGAGASSKSALAGTWVQEPNPGGTTSIAYTILLKQGKLLVKGMDEDDGTPLTVSRIRWDGNSLHFTTVFPPTGHKSKHTLTALSKRKMSQHVSCVYADGEVFSDHEIWRKRLDKKKLKRHGKSAR